MDSAIVRALSPAPEQITLPDALSRAQRVQPTAVQATGTLRNADAQQRSAYGSFLPTITASGGAGSQFSEGSGRVDGNGNLVAPDRTTASLNMGLNGSLELWTGLRRGADISSAKATELSAEAGITNAKFQVQLQTSQAYLDALAAKQTVAVRISSVRRALEQLKVSMAKLRAGSTTRSDSLRSEVNLGNARIQLINAEIQQATAEASLGRLIGATGRVEAIDDTTYYAVQGIDTTGLRAEALANSPQVQTAEANAEVARAQVRTAYAAYSPTLSLNGNYTFSGNSESFETNPLYNNRSLSLQLNWPLFNKFQREQTVVNRDVARDNAEATAADARRQVDAGMTQRLVELVAARARIMITTSSVLAATEDLRVTGERYRLGAATIVDLLTSQEALTQAEVDAVNARFDYLRAKAQLEALIGRSL
ncbi:MAG TPA: TolC family protein [Solirubrobacterales bacterium]